MKTVLVVAAMLALSASSALADCAWHSAKAKVDKTITTASITSAATTVTVTHRLGRTPTSDQIMVWPITTLGTAAKWWVDTPTSTTFVINVDAAPGATVTFGWRAFGSR